MPNPVLGSESTRCPENLDRPGVAKVRGDAEGSDQVPGRLPRQR